MTVCIYLTNLIQLALDLGTEVREHNDMLDGIGSNFDEADGAVAKTIKQIRRLTRSSSGGHMCVLFVFAFIFFILIYLLLKS